MRKREIKLSVYLNYDEWKMLTLKAEKVGYNKSALVRSLIEGFEPKEKPSEEFYEDLNSIRKVGNVLNQIARRAHYQGYIEDEKFLRKMENELQNLILNIKRKYLLPEEK
ncbi:MAG: plasmid mobilization protein [Lachnospirales bacterium]